MMKALTCGRNTQPLVNWLRPTVTGILNLTHKHTHMRVHTRLPRRLTGSLWSGTVDRKAVPFIINTITITVIILIRPGSRDP